MREGGVILYPTDTVWGLGCDARNAEAVSRIFALKRREDSKALITLVGTVEMLEATVGTIPAEAERLISDPSGRPVTIVYPHAEGVAANLLAPDGSIGVRLTSELFSSMLCRELGAPVVSTSANISGEPAPDCFYVIDALLLEEVDYVAYYRRDDTAPSIPSKVVKLNHDGSVTTLRP